MEDKIPKSGKKRTKYFSDLAKKRSDSMTAKERTEIAKKGNAARNRSLSADERKALAIKAVNARWDKWRAIQAKKNKR